MMMINSTMSDAFIYLVLIAFGLRALMTRVVQVAGDQDARDWHERITGYGRPHDEDPRDHPRKRPR